MFKLTRTVGLLLFVLVSASSASPFLGGDLKLSFNLDSQNFSFNDSADKVYMGTIDSGSIGFGGHADLKFGWKF
ncbi:MAG: hypothetical protein FD145_1157 [Candidatus Saganbacteria bacterium]|uniref:Uncharacterized protein n=1 Tax=Candidatus Saganbacteria bacterium TaxID=2575572 RepID=A0A833P2Y2_UNCSA|nr:MAG: hypothetical protein FD145_1157 [Candidatus Saganbacteria bacterium]